MTLLHDNIIRSAGLKATGVIQATSTRQQGSLAFDRPENDTDNVAVNQRKFLKQINLDLEHVSLNILALRHSTNVGMLNTTPYEKGRRIINADHPALAKIRRYDLPCDLPGVEDGLDACICEPHNVFLGMLHADCTPVCLYDPATHYFALIHAGTLGTIFGIVKNTIDCLKDWCHVQPENLIAYIGPCVSEKNYAVRESRHWPIIQKAWPSVKTQPFIMKNILAMQLATAGVKQIEISQFSTDLDKSLLYSNFMDKSKTGRNMTMIGV